MDNHTSHVTIESHELMKNITKKGDTMKQKKGRSQVLTNTPVKNALIKELSSKKKHKDGKPVLTEKKKASKSRKNTTKEMLNRVLFVKAENSSSDSENEMVFDDNFNLDIDMDDCTANKDEISVGDFILVEFLGKRVKKYFAGEVKEDASEGYVVTFLCRKSPSWKFVFLEAVDEPLVPKILVFSLQFAFVNIALSTKYLKSKHATRRMAVTNFGKYPIIGEDRVAPPEDLQYGEEEVTGWIQSFKDNFTIQKIKEDQDGMHLEFDLMGSEPFLANALRRILIAEVPTMAISCVNMYRNTSVMQDEVLAHRLGLVPFKAPAHLFSVHKEGDEYTDENSVTYELKVRCKKRSEDSS
ncbi:hypothetical protein QYM36_015670, partial [Artemia franciscana]